MGGEWGKKIREILENIKSLAGKPDSELRNIEKEGFEQFEQIIRKNQALIEPADVDKLQEELNILRYLKRFLDKYCPKNDLSIELSEGTLASQIIVDIERSACFYQVEAILERMLLESENDPDLAEKSIKCIEFISSIHNDSIRRIADTSQADAISKAYSGIFQCALIYLSFLKTKEKKTEKVPTGENRRLLCKCVSEFVYQLAEERLNKVELHSFHIYDYISDQINQYLVLDEALVCETKGQIKAESKLKSKDFCEVGRELYRKKRYKLAYIVLKQIERNDASLPLDDLCEAYNIIGLCAVGEDDYDKALEEYCLFLKNEHSSEENEVKKQMARIYNNLSYVLGTLYDRTDSSFIELKQTLVDAAIKMIEKAIELDCNDESYYCTRGTLYSNKAEIIEDVGMKKRLLHEAETSYTTYHHEKNKKNKSDDIEEKNDALRMLLEIKFDLLRHNTHDYAIQLAQSPFEVGSSSKNNTTEELQAWLKAISDAKGRKVPVEEWALYDVYSTALELKLRDDDDAQKKQERQNVFFALITVSSLIDELKSQLLHSVESKKTLEITEKILDYILDYSEVLQLEEEVVEKLRKKAEELNKKIENSEKSEENKIVYYTSVRNLLHLFEPLYRVDDVGAEIQYPLTEDELKSKNKDLLSEDRFSEKKIEEAVRRGGKNCFTVMSEYYMNDPTEGSALLEYLSNENLCSSGAMHKDAVSVLYDGTPEQLRDRLLTDKFIFLKSFNALSDHLTMWSMYGGDRNNNGDSDGVCVYINPETFSPSNTSSAKFDSDKSEESKVKIKKTEDDFRLYSIAYLGKDGAVSVEGKDNSTVKHFLEDLQILSVYIGNTIKNFDGIDEKKAVKKTYRDKLAEVAFLFKDASYSQEKEFRLLLFRDMNEQDMKSICMLQGSPAKLCLKPYFQVYIDKVVLGPKLVEADTWIPFFQMETNRIKLIAEKNGITIKPAVRKSTIPYR